MKEQKIDFLIVDDDQPFRNRLEKALIRRKYSVQSVGSFEDADKIIQTYQISYAILDLNLNEQATGLDLLLLIKKYQPDCAVLILTGYGTISTAVNALKHGAKNYLTKPTDLDSILSALFDSELDQKEELSVPTLSQVEWEHIQKVLDDNNGNITLAAKKLGLHRRSLQRKLSKNPDKLQ